MYCDCIFCKIVTKEEPCHKVWESEIHLAFLSIFPNTIGVTVVIPKEHFDSYAFQMPSDKFISLMDAAKNVALLLDKKLAVGRTALVLEGFGVNHVHAKLFPMHDVPRPNQQWRSILSPIDKKDEFYNVYPGFISSHDGRRANDLELALLAEKIRKD